MPRLIDIAGRHFGRWTVLAIHPERSRYGKVLWHCRCSCGSERIVCGIHLRRGSSTSCGCFSREQFIKRLTKHGHARRGKRTHAYTRWRGMLGRCFDPNNKYYCYYGALGVTVCERWLTFENHYSDVGDAPPGMSLDRTDVNGDYEPGNTRWATAPEQIRNRRPPKRRRRRSALAEIQAYGASLAQTASAPGQVSGAAPCGFPSSWRAT
jgi:hypothetical protein